MLQFLRICILLFKIYLFAVQFLFCENLYKFIISVLWKHEDDILCIGPQPRHFNANQCSSEVNRSVDSYDKLGVELHKALIRYWDSSLGERLCSMFAKSSLDSSFSNPQFGVYA